MAVTAACILRPARRVLGAAFLALQAALILNARFVPSRYFCWAPFSSQTSYRLSVWIADRPLGGDAIAARYRLPALHRGSGGSHWEENSIHHVMTIVEQYEESYGKDDRARVILYYSVNGREEQTWRYPP
jgi:hypothetical protein